MQLNSKKVCNSQNRYNAKHISFFVYFSFPVSVHACLKCRTGLHAHHTNDASSNSGFQMHVCNVYLLLITIICNCQINCQTLSRYLIYYCTLFANYVTIRSITLYSFIREYFYNFFTEKKQKSLFLTIILILRRNKIKRHTDTLNDVNHYHSIMMD